jgi:hypothetical protein
MFRICSTIGTALKRTVLALALFTVGPVGCAVEGAEQSSDDVTGKPNAASKDTLKGITAVDIKTTAVSGVVYHEDAAAVRAILGAVSAQVGSSPSPSCPPDLILTFRNGDVPVAFVEVVCGTATSGKVDAQLFSAVVGKVGSVRVDLDILNKYAPESWKIQRPPAAAKK